MYISVLLNKLQPNQYRNSMKKNTFQHHAFHPLPSFTYGTWLALIVYDLTTHFCHVFLFINPHRKINLISVNNKLMSLLFLCRYEFGKALYIGWGACALTVIGGSLLCCNCGSKSSGAPATRYPEARPNQPSQPGYV